MEDSTCISVRVERNKDTNELDVYISQNIIASFNSITSIDTIVQYVAEEAYRLGRENKRQQIEQIITNKCKIRNKYDE